MRGRQNPCRRWKGRWQGRMVCTESFWREKRIEIVAEKLGYAGVCVSVGDGRWRVMVLLRREQVKRMPSHQEGSKIMTVMSEV